MKKHTGQDVTTATEAIINVRRRRIRRFSRRGDGKGNLSGTKSRATAILAAHRRVREVSCREQQQEDRRCGEEPVMTRAHDRNETRQKDTQSLAAA